MGFHVFSRRKGESDSMKMIFNMPNGHVFTGTSEEAEKAMSLDAFQRHLLLEASRLYDGSLKFGYPLSVIQFEDGAIIEFVKTISTTTRKKA